MRNLSKLGGTVLIELRETSAFISDGQTQVEVDLDLNGFSREFPEKLDPIFDGVRKQLSSMKAKHAHLAFDASMMRLGQRNLGRVPPKEARSALLNELIYSEKDLSEESHTIVGLPFERGEDLGMVWSAIYVERTAALRAVFAKMNIRLRSIVHPTLSLLNTLEKGNHIVFHLTSTGLNVVTVSSDDEYDAHDLARELGRNLMSARSATSPTETYFSFMADPYSPEYRETVKLLRQTLNDACSYMAERNNGPRTLWLAGIGAENSPAYEALFQLMQVEQLGLEAFPFPGGEFAIAQSLHPASNKRKLPLNMLRAPRRGFTGPSYLRPVALGALSLSALGVGGHYLLQENRLTGQRTLMVEIQTKISSLEPYRAFALALKAQNRAAQTLLSLPAREAKVNPNWRILMASLIDNFPGDGKNYNVQLDALNLRRAGLSDPAAFGSKKPSFIAELSGKANSKASLERFIGYFEKANRYGIQVQGINYNGSLFSANIGMVSPKGAESVESNGETP